MGEFGQQWVRLGYELTYMNKSRYFREHKGIVVLEVDFVATTIISRETLHIGATQRHPSR